MKAATLINETVGKWPWWKEMLTIVAGCVIVSIGFVFFINPYNIVPGGVYGLGIVMHNIFPSVQVGTFGYMFDIPLLITAIFIFGRQFGGRTFFAACMTPGLMNIISSVAYPSREALRELDPSQLLGGVLDLSDHLMLTCVLGGAMIGLGLGLVVRSNATTGGTDIVAMILNRYMHVKFSHGVLLADACVVLSGLVVIGFGIGVEGDSGERGWLLSLYSLITIFIASRVVDYAIDGSSYDKLLFIISDHHQALKRFIIEDLDRSATYIKSKGMYTDASRDMIFLVVSRKEVHLVQHKIKEIDPRAFVVVTNAYDTYGEGFKPFPDKDSILNS